PPAPLSSIRRPLPSTPLWSPSVGGSSSTPAWDPSSRTPAVAGSSSTPARVASSRSLESSAPQPDSF
ncbi:hypothetical protein H0H92_001803, partial [Tricholoma furcatifolium]